ncbi:hypothetical protein [Halioxenophilus aromaticivorans]|uniref:J domain-containing protein n=1 Tax=Halioxenophilus aromaticivorans TaxID=1306992 RepID=A0AAV3TXR1_9ALTE
MITRFLLILAVMGICFYSINYIRRQPPEEQKKLWWKAGLLGGGATLALLAFTGKLHWVGLLIAAVVPLFKSLLSLATRTMPVILPWMQQKAQQKNQQARSTNTEHLQFVVDKNGDMGGMVLKGALSGKQLKDLTEPQLLAFLQQCRPCRDSHDVLVAYLNRYHPHLLKRKNSGATHTDLTESQALQILGLSTGASKDDIVTAHRSLIQKLHPDRGGNDYLAAQINAAKDLLLTKR